MDVVILDTLGELLKCYGICDVAFVGGSLVNIGGHNLLEPAAYGIAVLFGPYVESCRDVAQDLLDCGGGRQVTGKGLLQDPDKCRKIGNKAKDLLQMHKGAVSRYIELVAESIRGIL